MTGDLFLVVSENVALGLLPLADALQLVRLLRGPTLADRVLALDLLTTLSVSLIGVIALRSGITFQLDIALALCLVGFVSTVALARFVLTHRQSGLADPGKMAEPREDAP